MRYERTTGTVPIFVSTKMGLSPYAPTMARYGCWLAFLFLWTGRAGCAEEFPGQLDDLASFYLDLEGSTEARFADGALAPSVITVTASGKAQHFTRPPALLDQFFAPGRCGKGLRAGGDGPCLTCVYPAEKNVNSRQGTILFWIRLDSAGQGPAAHFAVNVPGVMYLYVGRRAERGEVFQALTYYFATPPGLKTAHNGWMLVRLPAPWKPGEWHQVALVWNLREIRCFADGAPRGAQAFETGRPMPADAARQLYLTFGDRSGASRDVVTVDEFRVFPLALPDALVERQYRQPHQPEAPARAPHTTQWQWEKLREGRYKGFFLDHFRIDRSIGADDRCARYAAKDLKTNRNVVLRVWPRCVRMREDGSPYFEVEERSPQE